MTNNKNSIGAEELLRMAAGAADFGNAVEAIRPGAGTGISVAIFAKAMEGLSPTDVRNALLVREKQRRGKQ